jgi:hypothetical protein
MRSLVVVVLLGASARADVTVPANEVVLGDQVVDLASFKVVRKLAARQRCDVDQAWAALSKMPKCGVLGLLGEDGKTVSTVIGEVYDEAGRTKSLVGVTTRESLLVVGALRKGGLIKAPWQKPGTVYIHGRPVPEELPPTLADTATTVEHDNSLIIALYFRHYPGSRLLRIDARNGAIQWIADVERNTMLVGKDYRNVVTLEVRGQNILLREAEDGQCSFQIFDLQSGKRRFASTVSPFDIDSGTR